MKINLSDNFGQFMKKISEFRFAKKFLETDPRGRDPNTEIRLEDQEAESDDFKVKHFRL